jgi:hypothetical protein
LLHDRVAPAEYLRLLSGARGIVDFFLGVKVSPVRFVSHFAKRNRSCSMKGKEEIERRPR